MTLFIELKPLNVLLYIVGGVVGNTYKSVNNDCDGVCNDNIFSPIDVTLAGIVNVSNE